jgi:hypothetical protein
MEASARTVVSPLRFSKRNMLLFCAVQCGAVRCGGRTAVGGGNATRTNTPARAPERHNNRTATSLRLPFLVSAHIMDLDFEIFDNERLITEVEKRSALYN